MRLPAELLLSEQSFQPFLRPQLQNLLPYYRTHRTQYQSHTTSSSSSSSPPLLLSIATTIIRTTTRPTIAHTASVSTSHRGQIYQEHQWAPSVVRDEHHSGTTVLPVATLNDTTRSVRWMDTMGGIMDAKGVHFMARWKAVGVDFGRI